MILDWIAAAGLALAALPAVMVAVNLVAYRAPGRLAQPAEPRPRVSVLIPARDEEDRIGRAVDAARASRDVDVEVVVMDDHSSDRTAEIVRAIAASDSRVRLEQAPPLPPGWGGKMHACWALAETASHPLLLFVDADVELAPDGVARAVGFLDEAQAQLASGFPRQLTGSLAEKLLIPLIHFVLLGYLPIRAMRRSDSPAFAAGCGQLMLARRPGYDGSGGHGAIRTTFHDGLQLPRAFRRSGLRTDLFDATEIAACRMYHGAREVVEGLAKNAHEGMAAPVAIWVWSGLLLGGHVMPAVLAAVGALAAPASTWFAASLAALAVAWLTRAALAVRFRQPAVSVLLHPVGVAALVAIQWLAWWRRRSGRATAWKGRVQVDG
jgi:hypothetical protein